MDVQIVSLLIIIGLHVDMWMFAKKKLNEVVSLHGNRKTPAQTDADYLVNLNTA